MEQGRNERCNCGSGKKYKQCCLLEKSTLRYKLHETVTNYVKHSAQSPLSEMKLSRALLSMCMKKFRSLCYRNHSEEKVIASLREVNVTWAEFSARIMVEEGIMIKADSFRKYIQSFDKLKDLKF